MLGENSQMKGAKAMGLEGWLFLSCLRRWRKKARRRFISKND